MGIRGPQAGNAIRRHCASGKELVVVPAIAWRRQDRADGRNLLRWKTHGCRKQEEWWQGLNPHVLCGVKHPFDALPDVSYVRNFYDRTRDLIDQHNPYLFYFDNSLLPLGWGGMNMGAYFYNHNLKLNGGKMEAVLNVKDVLTSWQKL